jgi:predicted porin
MKKSLIALAVLAASGAAMAQSSVQIYGDIDMGLVKSKTTNGAGVVTADKVGIDQGLISGGNIGFKGTEDLGGGLKAIFKVETNFSPDVPGPTSLGDKYAYVGLAGGFGEVQLGTVGGAYDDYYANSHSSLDSDFASPNLNVFRSTVFSGSYNNGVKYVTPTFGGFSGAVAYGFGENKSPTQSADSVYSIGGQYENGPVYVAAAFGADTDKSVDGKDTFYVVNGSYDLGVAKLKATYAAGKYKQPGFEAKYGEYELAVDVPVTAALSLSAGYASSQDKLNGVKDDKRSGYNFTAFYTLSKRTMAYAGYSQSTQKTAAGVKFQKDTLYAVGVQHKF